MKRALPVFFGLALLLHAEETILTNASTESATNSIATNVATAPTPEMSWTNVPEDCWDEKALPYAQAGLKAWYQETDPKKKAAIGNRVHDLANRARATEIGIELEIGKPLEKAELPVPTNSVVLPLRAIKEWDLPSQESWEGAPAVIRRIGPKNFELWTPKRGWLFDDLGKVLAEAKVPRRDGSGREWYGAFLPDGQWITTDLWERDDRIYLFSKENRLLNSFPAGDIVGWARADMTGTHWVTENNLRIAPWGWRQRAAHYFKCCHLPYPDPSWRFVEKIKSARDFVNPRELGSRGAFCEFVALSDDRKSSLAYEESGHGRGVGWPLYTANGPNLNWNHVIPYLAWNRYNFGFFPASQTTWVGGEKYPTDSQNLRSLIFDPFGKCLGWLPAERVGDDPDGKRMWFVDEQGRLLKVAQNGAVSEVLQPTLPGATGNDAPFAHVLFPDLKLGFFYTKPGHLVLACWN